MLWPLSYPERAGIPKYEEGANTPSQTRPETTASPTWASTTVTGTFHALPSVDLTICRTLPDSANLPLGPYCSAMGPAGQTHFSPNYPPLTSLLAHLPKRSLHTPTQPEHTINSHNNSRNYINPRNTLVYLNTITKRLYHMNKTRLLSDSPCHRKRPPPVRRQSPTTTTRGH